jgi:photosystem II stability/assembly factor-like uncharacterized protein
LSSQEGWIIGDRGRIFYTTDGGKTLERLDAGTPRAFLSIACFPDKSLVLTGKSGIVYRSPNGGRTFEAQPSGVERNLVSVAFGDQKTGIAVGDAGTIVRTADGGSTWQKIAVPTDIPLPEEVADVVERSDLLFYDVSFPAPDRAWIVGEFGVILTSTDGGLTWSAQKSPVQSTLFGVTFVDANNGWAVGMSAVMLRTRDGGATWQKLDIPKRPGFSLSLYTVAVKGKNAWAIGDSGFLLSSADGGETWKLTDVPIQMAATWFRGLSLTADGHGMITGADGLLLAIEGQNFTPLRKL